MYGVGMATHVRRLCEKSSFESEVNRNNKITSGNQARGGVCYGSRASFGVSSHETCQKRISRCRHSFVRRCRDTGRNRSWHSQSQSQNRNILSQKSSQSKLFRTGDQNVAGMLSSKCHPSLLSRDR